jgi:hypothetical protein
MRSQNLNEAHKYKYFTVEVLKMSQKKVTKTIFFIFVPRLDFSYALKPKNSGSDAMRLFTRDYGKMCFFLLRKKRFEKWEFHFTLTNCFLFKNSINILSSIIVL